ncbi:MAG: PAS domain S-box protein [Desulfarculaceae bacterium]|nr:PAS domain S-box protein [Desulfarculaceae bacterium]MCF8072834.1 PAS domain S-box protein [Desulfarculaceae bacterium]MCF8101002.1 PAS domain S-box protein [Desulfarculaceae bacterium]MCF8115611.1 PAS domain S-box protein [Desulfarculaceae bacterium]
MAKLLPQRASLKTAATVVVVASLLLFGLIAGYSLFVLHSVVQQAEEENLAADRAQASLGVLFIADHQHSLFNRLATVASRPSFSRLLNRGEAPELRAYLASLAGQYGELQSAMLTGPRGRVLIEAPDSRLKGSPEVVLPGGEARDPMQPWVSGAQKAHDGRLLVTLGVPIPGPRGKVSGYLAVRQSNEPWRNFLSHLSARPGRSYYLFDGHGGLLASGPQSFQRLASLAVELRRELGRRPGPLSRIATMTGGGEAFISASAVAGLGWVLVVAQPYDQAMAQAQALSRQVYLFLVLLAGGITFGTLLLLSLYRAQQTVLERTGQEARRLESEVAKRTAELRLANDRLRTLFRDLPDMVYEVDAEGKMTLVNRAVTRLLGYEPQEMVGRLRRDFVLHDDLDKFDEERLRAERGEKMSILALRHLTKDGQTRWLSVHSRGVFGPQGHLVGRRGVARDVTQQVLAERQVRELSRRLIGAQEDERKRLAQDLHDEMGQLLSALKIGLQGEATRRGGGPEMERLIRLTQKVMDRVRALAYNLRPAILDSFGLAAAARDLCEALSEAGLLQVETDIDELPLDLAPEVSLSIYRCLQEALNNVVRHSRSGWAKVELHMGEETLRMVVSDHGRGFDVEAILEGGGAGRSLGLLGIRERMNLLGGRMDLTSSDQGTRLVVEVPLEEAHA